MELHNLAKSISAHFHNFQTPFTSPQAGWNTTAFWWFQKNAKCFLLNAKQKMRFTVWERERERGPPSIISSYFSSPPSLFYTCSISFILMFSFHFQTLNSTCPVLYFLSSLLVLSHNISASFSSSDRWNLFLWLSSKAARFGRNPGGINSRRTVDSEEQKRMREMKRESKRHEIVTCFF